MAVTPRTNPTDTSTRGDRSISTRQWGALIGGTALAIYGITRRSPLGLALAASGGTVALLGSRRPSQDETSAWTSILINCKPDEVYRFWRNLEDLPRFMNRLQTVNVLDNRRSRWVANGPAGQAIRWTAEITDEREIEFIEWRSLEGSDVQVSGCVEFQEAPAGRGTYISARIEYSPIQGMGAFAKFLNKGVNFAMRQDLRRLEALMEAGEIPTTEGQPHGRRDFVTGMMRLADPTRPLPRGTNVSEAFASRRSIA